MKKVLFYCLFLFFTGNVFGQSWQNDLENQVEQALSNLDYSQLSTGILYEKIPTYYPFHLNDGTYIDDSISVMEDNFFLMYGMLDKAHTGTSPMMPVADYLAMSKILTSDENVIHFSILHYEYNRFKEYAIDQNLITYQNDHFYDVVNRTESPYTENVLFATTALRHETEGLTVNFLLESEHIFSNINNRVDDFEINFDDGNGWNNLLLNHNLSVTYPDTGLYRIQIRTQDPDGISRTSQTLLYVKESPNTQGGGGGRGPDAYSILPDDEIFVGTIDTIPNYEEEGDPEPSDYTYIRHGVEVFWWYGKCHEEILKPLIVVEGFDEESTASYGQIFGDENGPGLLSGVYNFPDQTPLIDKFFEAGFDIF